MNRPEPIELENNLGPDAVTGEINRVPWMAYDVDEMDIYIAEKDAEIAELKRKLEDVQATAYAEMVDVNMENRRLRRELRLTRAAMAKSEKDRWNAHIDCGNRRNRKDPAYVKTGKLLEVSEWRKLWADNERKCRANFSHVYLKSAADKVFADKDKAFEYSQAVILVDIEIIKKQKRKRCLAMAKWCFEKSYSTTLVKYDKESGLLRNFYDWWGKRWLELAEEPTWAKFLQLIHKEEK